MFIPGIPKALLPVGDSPLISHWMSVLEATTDVDKVYVVVSAFWNKPKCMENTDALNDLAMLKCRHFCNNVRFT